MNLKAGSRRCTQDSGARKKSHLRNESKSQHENTYKRAHAGTKKKKKEKEKAVKAKELKNEQTRDSG